MSGAAASTAEDLFVDLFQEAVGFGAIQRLQFQVPFRDLDGGPRYVDYALMTPGQRFAFEVDGEFFHRPDSPAVGPGGFRDSLLRQNSLIHQGWKLYRWTDVQLQSERERVVEQLRLFLEREIAAGSLEAGDLLPMQEGGEFRLHAHQEEALAALAKMRANGKTITLITHATGTGKTHVAATDARRLGLHTLYLAHTSQLPKQTAERFRELWPEAMVEVFRGKSHGEMQRHGQAHRCSAAVPLVLCSTFQAMARNLTRFDPCDFGYVIVDEAHHAAADSFAEVIRYFQPRFLLGLTATPERTDDRPLLQIFRETAHRLSLEEAIGRGLLAPIRCLRVETNVDLQKVRFNGVDYRMKDLEEAVRIPSRDELIADTYLKHARGKRAVCFCVNVDHAERVSAVLRSKGVASACVSGRMAVPERESVLEQYEGGEIDVLTACDMLNEGWDSPRTEVLLMARPTLSKILYVQQLGRGTRTAEGKKYLLVFDFVDSADRYRQALSAHRIFGKKEYRPGGLVAGPETDEQTERAIVLGLNIYETGVRPVDVFRWQDEAAGMLQMAELAKELRVDTDTVRERVRRGEIVPDLRVPAGEREYWYFHKETAEALKQRYGVVGLTEANAKEEFFRFVQLGDMSASYKPVLLLGMLQCADAAGRVAVRDLVGFFRGFYEARRADGLVVEKAGTKMARVAELDDLEIERTMLAMPFEKFERKGFFERMRDLAMVRWEQKLWRRMRPEDHSELRSLCDGQIETYYRKVEEG